MDGEANASERRFVLLEELGRGGFGTVYRGKLHGAPGFVKNVAIKVLNAEAELHPELAQRLRDEARLLALMRHRAIVGVEDLIQIEDRWAVVMEYIEGMDLDPLIETGQLPYRIVCEVIGEVARALTVAHEATDPETGAPLGIVHRDIKPGNIRVTSAGEVKVLDFGVALAHFEGREAKTRSLAFGSAGYMAPERFDGVDTPAADIYALGIVLYQCLVGEPMGQLSIRESQHAKKLEDRLGRLAEDAGEFAELIRGMVAYEMDDRPTAREVARTLRDLSTRVEGAWLSDWAPEVVRKHLKEAGLANTGDADWVEPEGPSDSTRWEKGGHSLVGTQWIRDPRTGFWVHPSKVKAPTNPTAVPVAPDPTEPSRWLKTGIVSAGLIGVLLVGLVVVVGAVVSTQTHIWGTSGDANHVDTDEVVGTPTPAPPSPAPVPESVPDSDSLPDPDPDSQPGPEPVPDPDPGPGPDPDPGPGPAPEPDPDPTPPGVRVVLKGSYSSIFLVSRTGKRHRLPGKVPPGAYSIAMYFSEGGTPVTRDDFITLREGQPATITCHESAQNCKWTR